MWSSYYLVACGLLLELANILWNRAGRSMVLLLAPVITSIGVWQFDFAWQTKVLISFLAVGLHVAVFTWGRQHLAELRKRQNEN